MNHDSLNAVRTFSSNQKLVALHREKIAKVSVRLFLEKGYQKTSVREVAETCNIGMGTLYHYVGSKEDILRLVVEYTIAPFKPYFIKVFSNLEKKNPIGALKKAIKEYYTVREKYEDFNNFWYLEARNLPWDMRKKVFDLDRELIAHFEQLLMLGCKTGHFQIENPRLIANNIITLGQMWTIRSWFLRKEMTLAEYTRLNTDIILRAIMPICIKKNGAEINTRHTVKKP